MKNELYQNNLPLFSFYDKGVRIAEGRIVLQNHTIYKPFNIVDIYKYITTNKDAEQATRKLREITDEKLSKEFKLLNFCAFTPGGVFSPTRKTCNLTSHSGLMVIDFDHLGGEKQVEQVRKILLNDSEFDTAMLFVSPRGQGLKWIIYIGEADAEMHSRYFSVVINYLYNRYELEADKSGRDVSRLCFLPFDPKCYLNNEFLTYEKAKL